MKMIGHFIWYTFTM